jgi:GT2 family glycosyltransferase
MNRQVAVCIPTYKRPHLLRLLILDLMQQTLHPDYLIIVDGDPDAGEVWSLLQALQTDLPMAYVPSNHGNLAYQRYLGWRVAAELHADVLVYFDDDERILQPDVLCQLVEPLEEDGAVGVGCQIRFGTTPDGWDVVHSRQINQSLLIKLFGSGRGITAGSVTPSGHRKPVFDDGEAYIEIGWLHGGVMAYSMSAISIETFSEDLFALDHIRCGLGEDTFLSRRVGAHGKLLYTFRAVVDHPNADTPKAYPYEAYKYAYAATYSRRFLNNYYRIYDPPTLPDRWALVKSYTGNTLLAWMRVVFKPSKLNWAVARGTTLGALHGLIRPPTAKRLTPIIDWWGDAEQVLRNIRIIRNDTT